MNTSFSPKSLKSSPGFTLAELLIALVILGVIATFTIPKILQAQQNQKYNAIAKETIAVVQAAYNNYKLTNTVDANTRPIDYLPNAINYVAIDTTSVIDAPPNAASATITCSAGANQCYRLHSGAILRPSGCRFGGTTNLSYNSINIDPDGVLTGNQDSVEFVIYFNGKMTSNSFVDSAATSSCGGADLSTDPVWFSW